MISLQLAMPRYMPLVAIVTLHRFLTLQFPQKQHFVYAVQMFLVRSKLPDLLTYYIWFICG